MLFQSNARTEVARSFGATLLVLATVVLAVTMIRLMGQATRGRVNPEDVTLVLAYTVLSYMPTLLTLGLFMAVVSTISRMYQDSEMAIWHSSGRGIASFIKPILSFAWPVFALITLLSLVVLPWTNLRIDELKQAYQTRGDVQRIERGLFTTSADGSRVFFIDKSSPDDDVGTNVFISSRQNSKRSITSAQRGRTEVTDAGRFLYLESGQRLELNDRPGAIQLSAFQRYELWLDESITKALETTSSESTSTADLWREGSPSAWAELSRRIGLIIAALNLVILGLCLSKVNPRSGMSSHMLMALFVFVVYFNLIGLGQNWIAAGTVTVTSFVLVLHGGVAALAWLWIAGIHNNWSMHFSAMPSKARS